MTTTTTMQIDPLALSRSDSISTQGASKSAVGNAPAATKTTTKIPSSIPRIDFEPIYTDLKSCIGIQWPTYQDGITRFIQGGLNHPELCGILEPIFTPPDPILAAKIESLHNQLICAILSNIGRDMPDPGVAGWVSANDKPAAAPKPVSGDAAEQRVKTEVKNLPARDRRRIKTAGTADAGLDSLNGLAVKPGVIDITESQTARGLRLKRSYDEYNREKSIRLPEVTPTSAGGLLRTNWEPEIRKRYTQPLFSEAAEFPSEANSVLSRLVPICYEESLPNGCSLSVAEFVITGTEFFLKEFLSSVYARTRCNAPGNSGPGSGSMVSGAEAAAGGTQGRIIMTGRYRKQLEKEEEGWKNGEVVRSRETGLLPIEAKETANKGPLTINDMKLAIDIGPGLLGNMPLIKHRVYDAWLEGEVEDWKKDKRESEERQRALREQLQGEKSSSAPLRLNGQQQKPPQPQDQPDEMDIDTDPPANADSGGSSGWEGSTFADRSSLDNVLFDILSAR